MTSVSSQHYQCLRPDCKQRVHVPVQWGPSEELLGRIEQARAEETQHNRTATRRRGRQREQAGGELQAAHDASDDQVNVLELDNNLEKPVRVEIVLWYEVSNVAIVQVCCIDDQ